MGILGDLGGIVGGILGGKADKKTNKLNKAQFDLQQKLADHEISISDYIQSLSKELLAKGSTAVDPYGGITGYDPETGTYSSSLGGVQKTIQDASDAEELKRSTEDQALRRRALDDVEVNREKASSDSRAALGRYEDFNRGIGAVDPSLLAAGMRTARVGALNAGYDDAQRAAQTLQLRTGSSALGDALNTLARNRVTAQAQIGDPTTEALTTAEDINNQRKSALINNYGVFSQVGQTMPDVTYTPAPYAGIADSKVADQMKFDLSKYSVAQGGSADAASTIGQAAAGQRQAYGQFMANRVVNPTGKMIAGLGTSLDKVGSDLVSAGAGGGGSSFNLSKLFG